MHWRKTQHSKRFLDSLACADVLRRLPVYGVENVPAKTSAVSAHKEEIRSLAVAVLQPSSPLHGIAPCF